MKSELPLPIDQRNGVFLLPGSRIEHLKTALPIMLNMINLSEVTVIFVSFSIKMI